MATDSYPPNAAPIDEATFASILDAVSAGEATHRAIAAVGIPRKQFYGYLTRDEEAGNRYARAKQKGCEAWADEVIQISDDSAADMDDDGEPYGKVNQEHIARSRLRVDSRKWLLSKLMPKKYGEKLELSGDDDSPLRIIVQTYGPKDGPKEGE